MGELNPRAAIQEMEAKLEDPSSELMELLAEGKRIERIGTGFTFTEGPAWHGGGYLLFSDIPGNRIWKWEPEAGFSIFREPSGHSNGLAFNGRGELIACEHGNRRLTLTKKDGSEQVLADRFGGKRLNSPNDVIVSSRGNIIFTDPPYGIAEHERELGFNGVFMLEPDGKLTLLADDFERPNGLALSPRESKLYISDSCREHIRRFKPDYENRRLEGGGILCRLEAPEAGVPDGMKVDCAGNLYATGAGGLWVFNPEMEKTGRILLPEPPANCAWGDADGRSLFLTARTSLYRLRFNTGRRGPPRR